MDSYLKMLSPPPEYNVKVVKKVLDEITPEEFQLPEDEYTYIISIRPKRLEIGDNKLEYGLDMYYEVGASDIEKLELMQSMLENELFPCDATQAKEVADVTAIPPLRAMRARVTANPGTTLHLFKTKFKMTRDDFKMLLSIVSVDKATKKLFTDSQF